MLKVLFIDDDKDNSELFRLAGEAERIWTVTFTNPGEALKFLVDNHVDVVVIDLIMPVLDGLTVAQQIRLNEENQPGRPRTELAFLTGAEITKTIRDVAADLGVRKICQKPCDMPKFLAEVKGWFGSGRAEGR